MSRVANKAAKKFKLISKLRSMKGDEAVTARRKLKEMNDSYYTTDPYYPSAGASFNPDGRRFAKGSDSKARNIQRGHDARSKQGMTR